MVFLCENHNQNHQHLGIEANLATFCCHASSLSSSACWGAGLQGSPEFRDASAGDSFRWKGMEGGFMIFILNGHWWGAGNLCWVGPVLVMLCRVPFRIGSKLDISKTCKTYARFRNCSKKAYLQVACTMLRSTMQVYSRVDRRASRIWIDLELQQAASWSAVHLDDGEPSREVRNLSRTATQ